MLVSPARVGAKQWADRGTVCEIASIAKRSRSMPSLLRVLPSLCHSVPGSDISAETLVLHSPAVSSIQECGHPAWKGWKSPMRAVTTCHEYLRRGSRDDRFPPEIRGPCCLHLLLWPR